MIIDAHNHPDWMEHDFNRHLADMDSKDIDKTWLLSLEIPVDEYDVNVNSSIPEFGPTGPIPFSRCLSYVERAPDRFVLGYAPDPRRPDAIDRLDAAIRIFGVRVCGEIKLRMMLDNLDAIKMYCFCGEKDLPVVVHIDYQYDRKYKYPRPDYWYGGGIEPFERAVDKCPGTLFLGHGPGFWAHISNDDGFIKANYPTGPIIHKGKLVRMLEKYPNLYCDLSATSAYNALTRDLEYTRDFLIEFQDRLLFARDGFDDRLLILLREMELPETVLNKIYGENARKCLN